MTARIDRNVTTVDVVTSFLVQQLQINEFTSTTCTISLIPKHGSIHFYFYGLEAEYSASPCRTRIRGSGYSSNPNRGSGGLNIRTAVHWMDMRFRPILKEMFFWHESHRLMDAMECPIQWFLVYASVDNDAKGFIRVREIGRLIAKLIYVIRCCIFKELMMRCDSGLMENQVDRELGGLMGYPRDLVQTPFGFLVERMRFAASIAREACALPQVSWLGIEAGTTLAIHGKRVGLEQLTKLCSSPLKEAKTQLDSRVKICVKTLDWSEFEAEDDLTNIKDGYSFASSPHNILVTDRLSATWIYGQRGDQIVLHEGDEWHYHSLVKGEMDGVNETLQEVAGDAGSSVPSGNPREGRNW